MIINELSMLSAGGLCHSSKLAFLQCFSVLWKVRILFKENNLAVTSVTNVDAHITNIVLTAKLQIFWVQHTQTTSAL